MASELLKTALAAAKKGADVLKQNRDRLTVADADEKGVHDFVTEIDRMSEKVIIEHIRSFFPDHSILAEESGYHEQKSEIRWIIDPLDGTTNFIHGYPIFAVSIAAQRKNRIEAGVVIDVSRDEIFLADRGNGTYLNDEKISVSSVKTLDKSLVLTGFPFKAHEYLEDFIKVFRDMLPATSGIRRCGSAAIDLAHIACGRADGFWEFGLSAWDLAAGALLIEEAGGVVTDIELGERYLQTGHILAGNRDIHKAVHDMIFNHFEHGHFIAEA